MVTAVEYRIIVVEKFAIRADACPAVVLTDLTSGDTTHRRGARSMMSPSLAQHELMKSFR